MAKFEISGYELYDILGRGGMAIVYHALHLNLDREVAIKIMDTKLSSDETFSERFIREARISARLVHPNILQIYDVNSYDTLNYISMELLEGGDLSHFIRGSMTQATIHTVLEQMTMALDYAADKGYVHRDIKPSNIMLRSDTEYVLADFGIAKAANSNTQMTQTGLMVGTPSYMSPEQAKGIEVDGRSDLYSMAVVCYEMLTKELPFDSDSAVSTAVKHLTENVPQLPEALAQYQPFIDKAMAKTPEERFQTGREMFQAFCEVRDQFSDDDVLIVGKTITARKPSGTAPPEPSGTDSGWDDATQVSSPSRPSRPYKLADTGQRDQLISGVRSDDRPAPIKSAPSSFGSTGFLLFAGALLLGGLAFGGYSYWQGQQTTSTKDLRAVTSELSEAYGALNNDDFERAAIAFRKVLNIDSDHAAALQGMAEVEVSYVAAIEGALASDDPESARTLFQDYGLFYVNSSNYDRLQADIEQVAEQKQLVSVQSDRITILISKADEALSQDRLFEPQSDSAYAYIQQALALDADSDLAGDGLGRFLTAALDKVYRLTSDNQFGDARDLLGELRGLDPGSSSLGEAQRTVARAEEAELKRQARWANYSPQKRQSILEQLARAEDLLAKGIYTSAEERDEGENAYDAFLQVLKLDPENASAGRSPERIARAYMSRSENAVAEQRFDKAEAELDAAFAVAPDYPALTQQREALVQARLGYEQKSKFQNRIDAVLAQADAQLDRVADGEKHAQEAARLYREALQLDLESEAAQEGLAQVVQFYITNANEAMAYGEFKAATAALNSARDLAPGRADLDALSAELAAREINWVTDQNVVVLIQTGAGLSEQGDYRAAAEKFSTALKMEPDSAQARSSLDVAVTALLDRAREGIKNGDFSAVRNDLADASGYAPEREDIADLREQLPELEEAWNAGQQVEKTIAIASGLYSKGSYSKAAATYTEALALSPESKTAAQGFEKSIAALVSYARSAMAEGDFSKASRAVTSATQLAPDHAAAAGLKSDLPRLEQEWQQQQAAKAEKTREVQALADTGMTALAIGDLDMAGQTYDQLAQNHPEMEPTRRLKRELLTAYISATRDEINNKEYDTAQEYLNRGQLLAPDYAAWEELEEELEVSRNSNRRRLGAY